MEVSIPHLCRLSCANWLKRRAIATLYPDHLSQRLTDCELQFFAATPIAASSRKKPMHERMTFNPRFAERRGASGSNSIRDGTAKVNANAPGLTPKKVCKINRFTVGKTPFRVVRDRRPARNAGLHLRACSDHQIIFAFEGPLGDVQPSRFLAVQHDACGKDSSGKKP